MDDISLKICVNRWGNSINKYLEQLNKRKVIIYGEDLYTLAIAKTTAALGYTVEIVLSNTLEDEKIKIDPLTMLYNYPANKYFVLVATLTGHKEAYENLIASNYKLNVDFVIMGIGGYTKPIDAIDSLLGFSRIDDDIPGFTVWKGKTETAFKIVILGNSTSDPTTGMLRSWSEILFEKLANKDFDVTIYNGATTGYCSTQEFLKLNRDVLTMNPDLVISFSGYNDIEGTSNVEHFPFLHKYSKKFYEFLENNPKLGPDSMYMRSVSLVSHGNASFEPDYMIWINNMRKMQAICQISSIEFVSYFQPMLETENVYLDSVISDIIDQFYKIIGISREIVIKKNREYSIKVQKKLKDYEFIKDLSGLFNRQTDVFYDICHYTEKGNRIIAEKIYKDIVYLISQKGGKHG